VGGCVNQLLINADVIHFSPVPDLEKRFNEFIRSKEVTHKPATVMIEKLQFCWMLLNRSFYHLLGFAKFCAHWF